MVNPTSCTSALFAGLLATLPNLAAARTNPAPIFQVSGPQQGAYLALDSTMFRFTYNATSASLFYLDDDNLLRMKTSSPNELDMPVTYNTGPAGRQPQLITGKKTRPVYPVQCPLQAGNSPDLVCTSLGNPWHVDTFATTYADIAYAYLEFVEHDNTCGSQCTQYHLPIKLAWAWA